VSQLQSQGFVDGRGAIFGKRMLTAGSVSKGSMRFRLNTIKKMDT